MEKLDKELLSVLSDLCINLAAAWYGLVIIIPNLSGLKSPVEFFLLTVNIIAGTVSLSLAVRLRKLAKE